MLLSKPRLQHYLFAHRFLRDKAFANPAATVDDLSRDGGSQYLKMLWMTTGLTSKDPEDEFIEPDDIACYPFLIGDKYRAVIVEFPEPLGPTEVFFVAIVIPIDAKRGDKCPCQYFTLELSADGPDDTVLGEWKGSGHLNCGLGPPSGGDYFQITIIARMLGEAYDPWKHERKFDEWLNVADAILANKNDHMTDDDVEVIRSLSQANKEAEFLNFLAQLDKRPGRPAVTAEAFKRYLDEIIKLKMRSTGLSYEEAEMELTVADHDKAHDKAYEEALDHSPQRNNRDASS